MKRLPLNLDKYAQYQMVRQYSLDRLGATNYAAPLHQPTTCAGRRLTWGQREWTAYVHWCRGFEQALGGERIDAQWYRGFEQALGSERDDA